jgi:hypothetical protein
MALPRLNLQMVALIGGNSRIIGRMDMEYKSGQVETDTLGSGCRVTSMGMEYSDGQVERYIKDNGNKIKEKAMHIRGGQVEISFMDSARMI